MTKRSKPDGYLDVMLLDMLHMELNGEYRAALEAHGYDPDEDDDVELDLVWNAQEIAANFVVTHGLRPKQAEALRAYVSREFGDNGQRQNTPGKKKVGRRSKTVAQQHGHETYADQLQKFVDDVKAEIAARGDKPTEHEALLTVALRHNVGHRLESPETLVERLRGILGNRSKS